MDKYAIFLAEYESSGMTQKAFGELKGLSAQQVNYRLRRAKEYSSQDLPAPVFTQVSLQDSTTPAYIEVRTSSGCEVRIPLV